MKQHSSVLAVQWNFLWYGKLLYLPLQQPQLGAQHLTRGLCDRESAHSLSCTLVNLSGHMWLVAPVLRGEGLLAEIRVGGVEAVTRCKACFSHLPGSLLSPLSPPLEPGGREGPPCSLKQVPHHIHLQGRCPWTSPTQHPLQSLLRWFSAWFL